MVEGPYDQAMGEPRSLRGVAWSLTSLVLHLAELCITPGAGAVAGTVEASRQLVGRLRGRPEEDGFDKVAERVAERLDATLATVPTEADAQEIQGAATAVEAVLDTVWQDPAAVLTAVRSEEDFTALVRRAAEPYRRQVAQSAEGFFDRLLDEVVGELMRLAPGSPLFQQEALTQLLDGLDRVEAGIGGLQRGQEDIKAGLDRIGDRLEGVVARPSGAGVVRFGSRPAEPWPLVTRRDEAAAVEAVIDQGRSVTVLTGMRGRGKSQLARAVAARCEAAGWPLVAWVTAGSRADLVSALAELGRGLGVSAEGVDGPEVLAARCLDVLRGAEAADRLVVVDNVESFDDLRGLVPEGVGLRVLVTTTRSQAPDGWHLVPVGVFDRAQSVGVLLEVTGSTDAAGAARVAEVLGDLPVAVRQAAATIRSNRYGFADYLDALGRFELDEVVARADGDDYPEAVGRALRLAYRSAIDRIAETSGEQAVVAAAQLGAVALLAASGVPRRWVEGLDPAPPARRALPALLDLSVCEVSRDGAYVSLHQLQRQVIGEDSPPGSDAGAGAARAAVEVLAAVDVTSRPTFEEQRREALDLTEQLRTIATADPAGRPDPWGLFSDPRTARALAHAIRTTSELGAPQEALTLTDTVALCEAALGADHPDTLTARHNLAYAYRAVGRVGEAVGLFEENLAGSVRVLGRDHPDTLIARGNLAGAYQAVGRVGEAVGLFEENLADRVRVLGRDHPATLIARGNLAYAYRAVGRVGEAVGLFEENLGDMVRVLGRDHPATLTARNNLAGAYETVGRVGEAVGLFEENLADMVRVLGRDHPDTLTARHNLAYALLAAGRVGEAVGLFEENLADSVRVLGRDHPDTLTARHNLAYAYRAAGREEDAAALERGDPPSREEPEGTEGAD